MAKQLALLLVLLLIPKQETKSTRPGDEAIAAPVLEQATDQAPVSESLKAALEEVATLQEEGDQEGARSLLREAIDSVAYQELLSADVEDLVPMLEEIARVAGSLGELEVEKVVRETLVDELGSELLSPDHPDLLASQAEPGRRRAGSWATWRARTY